MNEVRIAKALWHSTRLVLFDPKSISLGDQEKVLWLLQTLRFCLKISKDFIALKLRSQLVRD